MGYETYLGGAVEIHPPIPREQVESSRFRPSPDSNVYDPDASRLAFGLDEAGNATYVAPRHYEERNHDSTAVLAELHEIMASFPGHQLTGYLYGEGDDRDDMWRVEFDGGQPYVHRAEVCWPDAPGGPEAVRTMERALQQFLNALYGARQSSLDLASLDDLLLRAGMMWRCECRFQMPVHIERCDGCGREQADAQGLTIATVRATSMDAGGPYCMRWFALPHPKCYALCVRVSDPHRKGTRPMRTTTKHAVGRCVCGFGIAVTGSEVADCPNCGEKVRLQYVQALHNGNVPCDSNCMYAVRNICNCSCDGENHGAGYLGITSVPQWIRERDFRAAKAKQDRAEERKAREAAAAAAARDDLIAAHPLLAELADDGIVYASDFLLDMRRALQQGKMTDRQIEATEQAITGVKRRLEEEAARVRRVAELRAGGATVPTGKITFTGTILATRSERNRYGYGEVHKMLVEADDGWRAWGTIPSTLLPSRYSPGEWERAMRDLRGQRVAVTATVEASRDDPLFGFMKRPRVEVQKA